MAKDKFSLWKKEQGWDKLSEKELKELEKYCADYIQFLSVCKTERLTQKHTLDALLKAGYQDLDKLAQKGQLLKPGAKVYRSVDGKTIFAAIIGSEPIEAGLTLVGAHLDCPRLDLKPNPLFQEDELAYLDTHYYGGIKKYQWYTIPLALYGVVYRRDGKKVEIAIGDGPNDPVLTITDLLPHLDHKQPTTPVGQAFDAEKMNVLIASKPLKSEKKDATKLAMLKYLKETYGIEEEDFASAELEIVPAGPARELGLDRSMVLGYGQDDRVCSYGALQALLNSKGIPRKTRAIVLADKEEIGSYGRTGMDSTFIENSVAELVALTQKDYKELAVRRALERSNMLSADVSSLHDPMFPDVSAPNNMAKINCGIQLNKYTGARGKSGSSDASAEFLSQVRTIFNKAGVIWQVGELGKVDVGGGGTIALYLARYGMNVVDCGVGLFSMHAPLETAGKIDIYMAYRAYKAFLEAY